MHTRIEAHIDSANSTRPVNQKTENCHDNFMHRVKSLSVSKNGFVFDPATGQTFTLNHSGRAALDLLQSGATIAECSEQLAQTYGVPVEITSTAVEAFVSQIRRYL